MSNGTTAVSEHEEVSNANFKQLLENNADVKQLIDNNPYLKQQIETLDAESERAREIARLHQSLDILNAFTVTSLRTTNPAKLQTRIGDVVDILEVAIVQLKEKKRLWGSDDPLPEGECREPTPYRCGNGCAPYPC